MPPPAPPAPPQPEPVAPAPPAPEPPPLVEPEPEPEAAAPAPPAPEPAFEDFETFVPPEPAKPPLEDPGTDEIEHLRRPEPVVEPEPELAEPEPVAPPPPPPRSPEPVAPTAQAPAAPAPPIPEDAGAETIMPSALRGQPEVAEPATSPPPVREERKPKERKPKAEKPPKPPKPPRERKPKPEREPGSKALPIAIGAGVVALILGFLLGGSGGGGDNTPTTPRTPTQSLAAAGGTGSIDHKAPAGYKPLDSPPQVPGLTLSDASAVAPGGKDGGAVALSGFAKGADNPTLLPLGFLKTLGASPPDPDAVSLDGGLQAYRYSDLKPAGFDRSVTVYAAPTSNGVATLACLVPPDAADAYASTCDQMANTLTAGDGEAIPLGPSKDYAKALSGTLGTLAKRDDAGRAALARAKTPARQAAAARALAGAYSAAAASLAKLDVNPADRSLNAALVAGLRGTAKAYRGAASAAARNDKAGFRSAGGKVTDARAALGNAISALKAAGYEVSS